MAVVTERTRDMMVVQIRVDELRDLLHGSVAGARVQVGGDDSVIRDEMRTSQSDVVRGEAIALPILLLALLFVFRGWCAALVPLAGRPRPVMASVRGGRRPTTATGYRPSDPRATPGEVRS